MKLPKPSEGGGDLEPIPAGTHVGICYRFIDLGTQKVEWQGQIKMQRKVQISWLTPDELMADGRPFSVHKRYTWSMHEKASLRHDLESWRGKAFTPDDFDGPNAFNTHKLLGQGCMLTVTHDSKDGKTYSNVASVGKLMKGIKLPPLSEPTVYISLEADEFDAAAFEGLRDNMKKIIMASPEYAEMTSGKRPVQRVQDDDDNFAGVDPDDTIPF